jgi:hypothetical protein
MKPYPGNFSTFLVDFDCTSFCPLVYGDRNFLIFLFVIPFVAVVEIGFALWHPYRHFLHKLPTQA